jgi:hypothetical protein
MTGVQTFGVALIFILSLKYGQGGLGKRDIVALIVVAVGLFIWYLTQEAAYALFIVIAVDAAGAALTIVKAYEDPGSETISTWFLSGLSGLLAAFAVGEWNAILLAYPVNIWLINWAVVAAISAGKYRQSR